MTEKIKVTASIAIQLETGLTPKGRPAHRTTYLHNMRSDLTDAEVMHLVDTVRPLLAYPISNVRLVVKSVNTVWSAKNEAEKQAMAEPAAKSTAAPKPVVERTLKNGVKEETITTTLVGECSDTGAEEIPVPEELMQAFAAHGLLVEGAPITAQQPKQQEQKLTRAERRQLEREEEKARRKNHSVA